MRICPRCGRAHERKGSYCLACHNWHSCRSEARRGLSEEALARRRTRAYTRMLVRNGDLEKLPCSRCGTDVKVEAHHPDYSDPWRVIWLCRADHLAYHAELKALAKVSEAAS